MKLLDFKVTNGLRTTTTIVGELQSGALVLLKYTPSVDGPHGDKEPHVSFAVNAWTSYKTHEDDEPATEWRGVPLYEHSRHCDANVQEFVEEFGVPHVGDRPTYRVISDPGHGWLEVPLKDVLASGAQISTFSYYSAENGMVYLEEDGDMGTYLRKAKLLARKAPPEKGCEYYCDLEEVYEENTFIRHLPVFDLSSFAEKGRCAFHQTHTVS